MKGNNRKFEVETEDSCYYLYEWKWLKLKWIYMGKALSEMTAKKWIYEKH